MNDNKKERKTKEENKSEQIKNYVVGSDKVIEEKDEKRNKHFQDTPEKKKLKLDGVKKFLKIKEKKKKQLNILPNCIALLLFL
jgi:hypothetical protein